MILYRNISNPLYSRPLKSVSGQIEGQEPQIFTGALGFELPVAFAVAVGEYKDASPVLEEGQRYCLPATYDDQAGTVVLSVEVIPDRTQEQQSQKWEEIKYKRDQQKNGGVFTSDKWFHTDTESRIQWLGLVMLGANVPPVQWKTMDGSFITMTPAIVSAVFQLIVSGDSSDFANAETHRAAMIASSNLPKDDVGYVAPLDYDFSSGWRAIFSA